MTRRYLSASTGAALVVAGALAAVATGDEGDSTLTLAASGALTPTIAMDAAGAAYVAWVEMEGEEGNVYLARAGAAGEPVRVNAAPGDASTHEQAPPQVAVGPAGEVYVVWQKSRKVEGRAHPASDLRFARSADGGRTFGATQTVNDDAGGAPSSHTFHDVAVAADGTVYVSWLDSRERDRLRGTAADPGSEIRVASLAPGAERFGASAVVDGNVCPCCRTSLAVAPDGTVYVAWRKVFEGSVRDIAIASSTDGGRTFSAPAPVHRDGWVYPGCPHAGPSVAVDGEGRVLVAWYTGREGGQGLFLARSAAGGRGFGEPVAIVTDDWVPPSQVVLAVDEGGVWAAWDDRREEERTVRLARVDERLETRERWVERGSLPALAATDGRVMVSWQDGESVRVRAAGGGR